MTTEENSLDIATTPIPGLLVVNLPLHGDNRGWFKEHWQREKMVALGLPDFKPVQQNISFNSLPGTTRGFHAEPWDKYVSVANGSAFGAWVDLREGPTFGATFWTELRPETAVFVPRGVANAFQTLSPDTNYMYLVNDHWSKDAEYAFVNLSDPALEVPWPLPLDQATVSDKDLHHPYLASAEAVPPKRTLVLGASGQLGRALRNTFAESTQVDFVDRDTFDLTVDENYGSFPWKNYSAIINAAAFTDVDGAETPAGRAPNWQINASAVQKLSSVCAQFDITLVHVSSDYVFDGSSTTHAEDEPFSPINSYGSSKAAGDIAVASLQKHYIVRTSWVVGDGKNFVRTMSTLAQKGVEPQVISDQFGRLTFASELSAAIKFLLDSNPPYGTYNVTGDGETKSWYEIAQAIFVHLGLDKNSVKPTTTEKYSEQLSKNGRTTALRPTHSTLLLDKIKSAGFTPKDSMLALEAYINSEL